MKTKGLEVRWSDLSKHLCEEQGKSQDFYNGVIGCEFLEDTRKIDRLLTWGILNPFGPTVESLCLATDPTQTYEMLFVVMSNPFAKATTAYRSIPLRSSTDGMFDILKALFLSKQGDGSSMIFHGQPTFVVLAKEERISHQEAADVVREGLIAADQLDFQSEVERLRQFWLRPWDRLPPFDALLASALSQVRPTRPDNLEHDFSEWWQLVTHHDHVIAEWKAIIEAWEGAIEFQQDSALAKSALNANDGLSFHRRLLNQECT